MKGLCLARCVPLLLADSATTQNASHLACWKHSDPHCLQVLEVEKVKEQLAARNIPDFGPGAVLEVKLVSPMFFRHTCQLWYSLCW